MALSDCSCQVVWVKTLLQEIGFDLKAIAICGDNQGSIFIISNPTWVLLPSNQDVCYVQGAKGNQLMVSVHLFNLNGKPITNVSALLDSGCTVLGDVSKSHIMSV